MIGMARVDTDMGMPQSLLRQDKRDGLRSASDPIAQPPTRNHQAEPTDVTTSTSPSHRQFVEGHSIKGKKVDEISAISESHTTASAITQNLDDIFTGDDEDAAKIVCMAQGMSENRRSIYGARVHPIKERVDLVPGRSSSSVSRGSSARPFLTSSVYHQLAPRRPKTPSNAPSSQAGAQQSYKSEDEHFEHQRRHQPVSSPLRLTQQLSPTFSYQPHLRTLPFNQTHIPQLKFNPSSSTLARVSKARQYLDLFTLYIDLISSLPPTTEPQYLLHNQQQQQTHYHNTNHFNQQVIPPQHPLRKYNPLQTIRNRRLRNRQGLGQLDLTPWEDAVVVDSWVDTCIHTISSTEPQVPQDTLDRSNLQSRQHLPSPPQSRPLEKGKSKPKRSKLDWVVHPSELFADFYWINEGSGVTIMEDRFGERIFRQKPASAAGSNVSAPSSVGPRLSMEKARVSGRGKGAQEEHKPDTQGRRWYMKNEEKYPDFTLQYEERYPNLTSNMDTVKRGDNQEDQNAVRRPERSIWDSRPLNVTYGSGSSGRAENTSIKTTNTEEAGDLSLPAGPGITIGIGGGYVSPDDSPYDEDSEEDGFHEEKGRISLDSRRYSSQFEDDTVSGDIPLRRTFFENSEKTSAEKGASRKRHHHHLYPFGRRRRAKQEDGEASSASTMDLSASESTDSEVNEGRKKHKRKIIGRRSRNKTVKNNSTTEVDVSAEEDLTADGVEVEDLDRSRLAKHSPLIRKLKEKTRREKRSGSKFRHRGESDEDTNYESVAGISRSPSPAVITNMEFAPRSSFDHSTLTVDFAHASSLQSRTTLAPPPMDKRSKGAEQTQKNSDGSLLFSSPLLGIPGAGERGRVRKDSKDDGFGTFLKRAISPMKIARRSSEYNREEELVSENNMVKRDSKESDRDLPSLEKEKDKEKRSRTIDTVKKAKEKMGNRVDRIKQGVGLVWGREAPQSLPSSNYASSMGSAGGTSGKEDSDDDENEKVRKNRLSLDLDSLFRNQKKRFKSGNWKHISGANLAHFDLDSGTATPSEASVEGDGDEYWRRGLLNDDLPKLEIPTLKVMGPSREHSPVIRRTGSGNAERPGGVKLKRERSRLAEEIKGDSDSPAIDKGPDLAPLGRVKLPPIATIKQREDTNGATKRRYMGKRDLARARTLMLSTGILARGMASQTQTVQQAETYVSSPPEFIGTLQLTTYHHTISAKHLSSQIHTSAQDLDSRISAFQRSTLSRLREQILGIQDEVSAKLIPLLQTTADEADVLSGELSTKYVLEVKRLNDEVSTLARRRRRTTLKWVRRGGYVLLEWVVLGVMWWVWLIVVMVRMVRVVIGGVGRGIKWMVLWK